MEAIERMPSHTLVRTGIVVPTRSHEIRQHERTAVWDRRPLAQHADLVLESGVGLVRIEGLTAHIELPQHDAERVHVGLGRDFGLHKDLGRSIECIADGSMD